MTQRRQSGTDPWDDLLTSYAEPERTQRLSPRTRPMPAGGSPRPVRRRRSKGPAILLTFGLVLAILAGGTAVVANYVWYGWGDTRPEQVLPDSVAAFLRVDLSPGLGQQLALNDVAQRFPSSGATTGTGHWQEDLVRQLDLGPLTYDDVKAWLGDGFAVAEWSADGSAEHACELIALASTNDAAARASLARLDKGVRLSHGYALLADCPDHGANQSTVDKVVTAAEQASLARRSGFATALAALPPGQAVVGWADLAAAGKLGLAGVDGLTGELLFGAQATDSGIEARFRLTGQTPPSHAADALAELGALPATSMMAVSADLGSMRGVAEQVPPSLTGTAAGNALTTVLGSVVSVSVTSLGTSPAMQVVVRAIDAAKAKDLGAAVGQLAGLSAGALRSQTTGDHVTLTTSTYRGSSSTLDSQALFREAMAGAAPSVVLAAYVDMRRLAPQLDLDAADRANVAPVRAIGLSTGYSGDTMVGLLRVVIH